MVVDPRGYSLCSGHENHPMFLVCANKNTYFIKAILVMSLCGSHVGLGTHSSVALKGLQHSGEMEY